MYHPDVELKLNDLVEVTGVYSLSPDLILNFDGMDLAASTPDILAKHPPSSLVRHFISNSSPTVQRMSCTCPQPNASWLPDHRAACHALMTENIFSHVLQVSNLHCLRVRKIAPFEICQAPFLSGISHSHQVMTRAVLQLPTIVSHEHHAG